MIALALGLALAGALPHDAPGEVVPDRHWDVIHLDLNLTIDVEEGTVEGVSRHTVQPLGNRWSTIRLHQVALDITGVRVDDTDVSEWRTGQHWVEIPMPADGDEHRVEIAYRARPQTGLHFRNPATGVDPVVEVWSQGENEDNRHWFPSWDHPTDKFTLQTQLTVPNGLTALSNGLEVGREAADPGWTTWTYRLDRPIVNYLVALTVGDYRVETEEGPVPLEYVGARTHKGSALRRGFDQARPQMVYLAELLDEPFPYSIYRQVMVSRFLYGGMENSTLTIMSDRLLQPVPGGRIRGTEEVTAHELAHQWFGDLLTCYGWRELWLNEGFATFYTGRWMEHSRGEDYYATKVRGWMSGAARTSTPMAPRGWSVGDGPDNAGVYVKGATVLHMLRVMLGDETFDRGIRLYVDRNLDRLVETDDLRRALEDVSGTHLGWFFDQWVHGTGLPAITSGWAWSEGELVVTLSQTTEEQVFWMPVEIEIGGDEVTTRRVWLGEGEARLVLPLEKAPDWVAVDPRGGVLASWERDQEPAAWAAQARQSPSPFARLTALQHLGDLEGESVATEVLAEVLADEELEPALRRYAAEGLGSQSTEGAVEALLAALDTEDSYLREDVVDALGETEPAPRTINALVRTANQDWDPQVQAAALRALAELDEERGRNLALKVLAGADRSWLHQLHSGALSALSDTAKRADLGFYLDRARPKWSRGIRYQAGWGAIGLLNREGKDDPKWSDNARRKLSAAWIGALDDPDQRVREAAVSFLGSFGDSAAEDALERFATTNEIVGLSEEARSAAASIRNRAEVDEEPVSDEDLEKLGAELDALRERLERLEEWR